MPELLLPLIQLPTLIYTALLVPIIAYWTFVVVGIVDIEILDSIEGVDGLLDGAAEGAGEALDGALDAGMGGAAEALDGADGAMEPAGSGSTFVGLVHALKLRNAPLTVVGTFIIFYAWALSLIGSGLIGGLLPIWLAGLIGLASLVVGVLLTSATVRPLGQVFVTQQGPRRRDFIGGICTISTGRVNDTFGQATLEDGGAGQLIQVRCTPPNTLNRGSQALIVNFDRQREAYIVEPMDAHRG